MDMDGNRYPDILVGSLDDRMALLRLKKTQYRLNAKTSRELKLQKRYEQNLLSFFFYFLP